MSGKKKKNKMLEGKNLENLNKLLNKLKVMETETTIPVEETPVVPEATPEVAPVETTETPAQ